ncbi:MAG: hypothetical protein MUC31_04800 [Bacteroidales bacterium]|nr:hypothetical protein [Bacteroidales bacterium]
MRTVYVFTFIFIFIFLGFHEAMCQWSSSGANIFNTNTGNVGIGNSTPSTLLHVAKSMTEPTITVQNLGGAGGATYTMTDNISGANWKFKATNSGGFKIRDHANGLDVFVIEPGSSANAIYIKGGGNVGIGTSSPHNSAVVEMSSTTKGVLLPRLTFDQRNAITSPADGLMVFCTDCGSDGALSVYSNSQWRTYLPCNASASSEGSDSVSPGQIIWDWNEVPGAEGYKWNTSNSYSTAIDMGILTSKTETGIACNNTYTRYVWTYNSCGISEPVLLSETVPSSAPVSPAESTHVPAQTSVVWNWNTVSGATGYKWNTVNDPGSATDLGTLTAKTETGLVCDSLYTRFAWAYNGCGNSVSVTLTQSTLGCWICGDSLTIDHVAGTVAPVSKTVTYGTVTNVPGETAKCWITSNLGADHQATAVNDATEESAGWYWQFNRMQGYKNDGVTVTPAWTITSIDEDSDWISANDPCSLELGNGWRLPTYTEWTNVDASDNWTDWNGPWSSVLKLHAAGYLQPASGAISLRGSSGYSWSSSQINTSNARYLYFLSSNCFIDFYEKAFGANSRCIRD